MHSGIANEIWIELQRFFGGTSDRTEAADILVSILINNDEHAEDIAKHFGNDRDIKAALSNYLDEEMLEEDDYIDNEDDDEDEEW